MKYNLILLIIIILIVALIYLAINGYFANTEIYLEKLKNLPDGAGY